MNASKLGKEEEFNSRCSTIIRKDNSFINFNFGISDRFVSTYTAHKCNLFVIQHIAICDVTLSIDVQQAIRLHRSMSVIVSSKRPADLCSFSLVLCYRCSPLYKKYQLISV